MLADAAATTLFTVASPPLMLADAAAATLFTAAPLPLMLADAAAATLFTAAPHPLMLADAAAATLFTLAHQPSEVRGRSEVRSAHHCGQPGREVAHGLGQEAHNVERSLLLHGHVERRVFGLVA